MELPPQSLDDLVDLLDQNGINHSLWVETGKTVKELMDEVVAGEAELIPTNEGLRRVVNVACIDVFACFEFQHYHLLETDQVWYDGRYRQRQLSNSVSEKLKDQESPLQAAVRGIKEELGLEIDTSRLAFSHDDREERESESYKGLISQLTRHWYVLCLTSDEFSQHRDGFVEDDGVKQTFLRWQPLNL